VFHAICHILFDAIYEAVPRRFRKRVARTLLAVGFSMLVPVLLVQYDIMGGGTVEVLTLLFTGTVLVLVGIPFLLRANHDTDGPEGEAFPDGKDPHSEDNFDER